MKILFRKVLMALYLWIWILSFGCSPGDPDVINEVAQLLTDQVIMVNGINRYFNCYLPARLKTDAPLVILLHGGGGNKDDILEEPNPSVEWKSIAEDEKFTLIIPNGSDSFGDTMALEAHWNDCRSDDPTSPKYNDVEFISQLIDRAVREYVSDSFRVYVTGSSNGGMMSYRIGLELADKVTAIAAFIANRPANQECLPKNTPRSVFICNGTKDPLMPWSGGQIAGEITIVENRGNVMSAHSTLEFWKSYNRALTLVEEKGYQDINSSDQSTVSSRLYQNEKTGVKVKFYTVNRGGHIMPSLSHHPDLSSILMQILVGVQNKDIEGTRAAWDFFKTINSSCF